MRKILWNLYAWPMTLLIVVTYVPIGNKPLWLLMLDFFMSFPSLLVLHLYIWELKFLRSQFWKMYAIVFVIWDCLHNLVLSPMIQQESFDLIWFIGLILLLPLYIVPFRYAYITMKEKDLANIQQPPSNDRLKVPPEE